MGKLSGNNSENWLKTVQLSFNASGAAVAALRGDVVVVVDVIDMSTTAEAALDSGAKLVLGAASDLAHPPVKVDPEQLGFIAGEYAVQHDTEVIVISEPRWGTEDERIKRCKKTLDGISRSKALYKHILPNIGGEVSKLIDFTDKVVIIVSDTGGVAFDAAYTNGAPIVLTATVCRTMFKKGRMPAEAGVQRAISAAQRYQRGITFIAASANSYEDILAAEYLTKKVIETGFLT